MKNDPSFVMLKSRTLAPSTCFQFVKKEDGTGVRRHHFYPWQKVDIEIRAEDAKRMGLK